MKLPPEELTVEVSVWKEELSSHPDQQYANFIITGLEEGFRIGFKPPLRLIIFINPQWCQNIWQESLHSTGCGNVQSI